MSIRMTCTLALTLLVGTPQASAADWPSRPIRFVVPATPGGGTDLIARVVSGHVSDALGQPVVLEFKPGAEGIIAHDYVAKATPDGHTVLITASSLATNASTYTKLPFDTLRDFQPVAQIATLPYVLIINPKVPARSVAELVAHSRKQPTGINAGLGGNPGRLVTELFRTRANANLALIPYKGCGPAVTAVLTGETDFAFCSAPALAQFVLNGRLIALAVTGDKRLSMLPDVPTTKEIGVPALHVDLSQWVGAFVPRGTPPQIGARLNATLNKALSMPDVVTKLGRLGAEPEIMTVAQYTAFFRAEVARVKEIVVRAKIPPID